MGILDTIASFIPFTGVADAEAPPKDEVEDNDSEVTKDDGAEEDEKGEEAAGEEEEEEEDEDEVVDPMDALREECTESKECKPAKHHYDECAARVTEQTEKFGKPQEDCVEEFFHLAHCVTGCATPKLWSKLR